MISQATIDLVKSRMDVADIVGAFVKLKKQGVNLTGLCPFHAEKSPSFTVSPAKQIYKCFGCGRSGDAIAFLVDHEKLSYLDTIRWIANRYNIEVEETQRKEFVRPEPRLEKLGKKALEWFEHERKISNYTLLKMNVTEGIEFFPQLNKECPAICFNYYRGEQLVNIKFRGPKKSFTMAKSAELIFYNLNAIEDEQECVIVEGEIDCLTCEDCGIHNSVSVPNGAAAGQLRLEYLDNCYPYFTRKTKIILATDDDPTGRLLREELARRLGYERCWQVTYPDGCKDLNDVKVKYGKEEVVKTLSDAIRWPISGLIGMDEIYPEMQDYFENGYPKGFKTHIPEFDEKLTFYPGQLTTVTGIPGSGKSEFVDYIMTSLTKFHGWTWGICSFECPPAIHATKLAEKFTDKSFAFRKNPADRMNKEQFEYAVGMIDKHFHFINLSMVEVTMDGLISKAEELVQRKGINGLLFDPWNCIEHKYGEENETKYILSCLNKLITFLDKYKVHGFLVAHPTKMSKDKKTNKYEIPTLYSISGSAHFFNRTHNGISVWRDYGTNVVDVYVQKVKWSWLGSLGHVSFHYNTQTRQYQSIHPQEESGQWKPLNLPFDEPTKK